MSIIQFPDPPSARDASEGGASPGAPLAMSPPGEAVLAETSVQIDCRLAHAGSGSASSVSAQHTGISDEISSAEAPIRLLCKTLERAALTKEQRFRAWLGQNPVMERNPYARQWFENAEAAYDHNQWKDYQEERDGDVYR